MARVPVDAQPAVSQVSIVRKQKKSLTPEQKENVAGYLFLTPWFIGLFALSTGPVLYSLYLSFTNFDLLSSPVWVGLQNYIDMFSDAHWLNAVRVTVVYVFLAVPLKLIFALLLALLLKRGLTAIGLYRAIYYVPSLLGGSVAIAILWRQVFDSNGLVLQLLHLVGIQRSDSIISSPDTALSTLIVLSIWQFGSPMIIFLAALKQIPNEYYEAASTDGSGKLNTFFRITIPLITPMLFFNLVLQMIDAFQAFTPAFIISGGTGGPVDSTMFYTLYIYTQGFGSLHMGYASAMAWFLLIVISLFTAIAFRTSRYWVFYQDGRE
jgi:multiple sugar transport system permease protein